MRDNSRNLAVRMTDEQYEKLQRFMELTNLPITAYFRHLIDGYQIQCRSSKSVRRIFYENNMIYSNLMQINRNPRAKELGSEQLRTIMFLREKLGEEIYLLTSMESAL